MLYAGEFYIEGHDKKLKLKKSLRLNEKCELLLIVENYA
ncbi:hypothetical protein ACINWC743_2002 [Acinetobacter sp. WC-743]|nr:hypothetical protein ACINWC743_2002 [Acinetobacter sp. WC-743]